jgi:hypothetical protein
VLAHHGVVALPCRVGDPDRKGKVESAIGHTQAALKGLRFETLEAAQAYLDRWDARWTIPASTAPRSTRSLRCLPRSAPPVEPFRYYQFGRRTVHLDNCIEVEAAYYSAPPGWLGQEVAVQWPGVVSAAIGTLVRNLAARPPFTAEVRARRSSRLRRMGSSTPATPWPPLTG